jgi:hypothetical protein
MADEGGAHTTGGGAGVPADHHNSDIPQPKQFNDSSRKSTLTKSAFDVNAASYGGTSTPMGTGRESIDLTDYFVRLLSIRSCKDQFSQLHRLALEIWTDIQSFHILCGCTEVCCHV